VSNPLTSVFKFQPKLRQCLVDDRAHIGLTTFPARRFEMDELDESNDLYDQETADLVTTFKELHRPPILNFVNQIDAIVGKKTIAALDDELPFQR